eukprot:11174972-Heterocapsa_arctica.AAC.1
MFWAPLEMQEPRATPGARKGRSLNSNREPQVKTATEGRLEDSEQKVEPATKENTGMTAPGGSPPEPQGEAATSSRMVGREEDPSREAESI